MAYGGQGGWPPGPPGGPPGGYPQGPAGWPGGGGYGPPPPPPVYQSQGASSRATTALILAIGSWVLCGCLMSLPAVFLAKSELADIDRGAAPLAGKGMAQAAFWVALINLILYGLVAVLYVVLIAVGVVAGVSQGNF